MFNSLKRAMSSDGPARIEEIERELVKVADAITSRENQLAENRSSRQEALYPEGAVEGAVGKGRFPGLHPFTFEEEERQTWLVAAATGIIDNFPGSEGLLSQLDATFSAYAEANHLAVSAKGPYSQLAEWQAEILSCWDIEIDVPVFVGRQERSEVLGCREPFVVLGRYMLEALEPDEQRFLLAASLGHVFFGNLRIFAFYRLFEMLDKLPSMTRLIARGLGMIPGVGNTISKGLELAQALNQQVIRKTNLVVGQRQHVLCDRLATLAFDDQEAAQRTLCKLAIGGKHATDPDVRASLIEQGRRVSERFEAREIDLTMLSIVGPSANFAAWRAYKLDTWHRSERAERLREGYYVTRERLAAYRLSNQTLEAEISRLEGRLIDLHARQDKLSEERAQLLAGLAPDPTKGDK
ncbi:MAG: hypothetical protein JKY65_00110 [Planctomycetes bacterium]|nr:hypothetical protein [Planctomycetota bacterium]